MLETVRVNKISMGFNLVPTSSGYKCIQYYSLKLCIFPHTIEFTYYSELPFHISNFGISVIVGEGYRGVKNSRLSKNFEDPLILCQNMCLGTRNSNIWKISIFECPPGLFMDSGDKCCQNRGFWSVKIQLFQILTYDLSLEA